jgi:hypothetical protein
MRPLMLAFEAWPPVCCETTPPLEGDLGPVDMFFCAGDDSLSFETSYMPEVSTEVFREDPNGPLMIRTS